MALKATGTDEETFAAYASPFTLPQSQGVGVQAPKACTIKVLPWAERMTFTTPRVALSQLVHVPSRGCSETASAAAGAGAAAAAPAGSSRCSAGEVNSG